VRRVVGLLVACALTLGACRGEARQTQAKSEQDLARLVDSLRGPVERATGLRFTSPPRSAMRSKDQVRAYLIRKLDEELPPKRLHGLETTYRLFGLLPDTLQLRPLLIDLYTEQVAGFYDPDSATLFGVEGADRTQLSLVLAHELIHALQGQHLPLDSILDAHDNNDRLSAAQAILEGQATLASLDVLAPGHHVAQNPQFWEMYREQVRRQQSSMPVFRRAPLVLRETLIFPYLQGAEFMHWWNGERRGSMPYGPRMPVSTEQVLHPDRYARGDVPLPIVFPAETGVAYEDVLGEAEIRVVLATLAGSDEVQTVLPIGWGADRYRLYQSATGPALVWYVLWDDARSAGRFLRSAAGLRSTARPGYRAALDSLSVSGRPATRYLLAPSGWERWDRPPQATSVPGVSGETGRGVEQ
jgi:hypothetical protein